MNTLFLTNNPDITKPLYDWLCEVERKQNVTYWDSPLTAELFKDELKDIEFIVSYNYRHIIKRDVINRLPQRIINLHTSLLPWNRGASPNFWSFIDDTPKGVTIHQIDEGIDTGAVLFQRQVCFDEGKETFVSSYNKLHAVIQGLFKENWDRMKNGAVLPKTQGSYHTQKETDALLDSFSISWHDNIAETKAKLCMDL